MVSTTLGLISLTLLGAAPFANAPSGTPITTEVRIYDLDGLTWRTALYPQLEVISHQGTTTVWSAPRTVLTDFDKVMKSSPKSNMIAAPKVASFSGATATITTGQNHIYVAGLGRVGDGPIGQASRVAYRPDIQAVPDGCKLQINGRALDQGVLAQITIDDIWLLGVHTAAVREKVKGDGLPGAHPATIQASYQIPEVATAHVAGEWIIPKDGLLIVSLGAHTVTGKKGDASLHERVAVIASQSAPECPSKDVKPVPTATKPSVPMPNPVPAPAVPPTPRMAWFVLPWHPLPVPLPIMGMPAVASDPAVAQAKLESSAAAAPKIAEPSSAPMPLVPSRALPMGVAPDGSVVLPPLPEGVSDTPEIAEESAEVHPSPQTGHVSLSLINIDQSNTTFTTAPPMPALAPPARDAAVTTTQRSVLTFALGNRNFEIELRSTTR